MKNPFLKEDHTALWIAAAVTGGLAACAGIWFYLHGKQAAAVEAELEYAQDYLKDKFSKKKKKIKTDLHELEDIVHH